MPVEEPAEVGVRQVGAWQWVRTRVRAASAHGKRALFATATVTLDRGIACLQGLRKRAAGEAERDAPSEHRRPGNRAMAQLRMDEPVAAAATAPKPRRRLRRVLVYLSVMLAGGMFGTALAFNLLTQLLSQQTLELQRKELKLAGYSKSVAELQRRLAQQQTQRAEVEARLAKSLAQNATTLEQMRAQHAAAEARLAQALAARASIATSPKDAVGGIARSARGGWTGSGNCIVGSGDARAVLANCIAAMNRK